MFTIFNLVKVFFVYNVLLKSEECSCFRTVVYFSPPKSIIVIMTNSSEIRFTSIKDIIPIKIKISNKGAEIGFMIIFTFKDKRYIQWNRAASLYFGLAKFHSKKNILRKVLHV